MVAISSSSYSTWGIPASGLRDANLRMAVTANNVANGNTDGFVPDRVDSVSLSNGGVDSVITPGEPSPDYTANNKPPSQTDYATEGVKLALAKNAFQASIKAFKAQNEASKSIIDAVG